MSFRPSEGGKCDGARRKLLKSAGQACKVKRIRFLLSPDSTTSAGSSKWHCFLFDYPPRQASCLRLIMNPQLMSFRTSEGGRCDGARRKLLKSAGQACKGKRLRFLLSPDSTTTPPARRNDIFSICIPPAASSVPLDATKSISVPLRLGQSPQVHDFILTLVPAAA